MGLAHQFAIISQYSNESIISSDMDCVSVSDMVIQYIGDSLKWVHTMNVERKKVSRRYFILWIFSY